MLFIYIYSNYSKKFQLYIQDIINLALLLPAIKTLKITTLK